MTAKFEITVDTYPEHAAIRGNAMASDDPEADRALEDELIARLNAGDEWAWCIVRVTVSCGGLDAYEDLGCCSYESEADFRENSGYFDDMVLACKLRLVEQARAVIEAFGSSGED